MPGSHIGVDAHLLAGHGVQGESRRDLGDPLRSLGDDHELNDGDNEKNHAPHHVVARHHEVAEGVDDLAGIGLDEDQARGGDIEGEAKEGGDEQQGRKDGKVHRRGDVEGDHQEENGESHVRRKQAVENEGGNGEDHEGDNGDQQPRQDEIGVPVESEGIVLKFFEAEVHGLGRASFRLRASS